MHALARYALELVRPDGGWAQFQEAAARTRRAAEEMQREGTPVRLLRSIFIPKDQTCFFLFERPTAAAAVRDAAGRARPGAAELQKTITEVEK